MIKFFRKIRQQLLSENKFTSYLIYAVGEIVLVVIGILIALQINNWNIARMDGIQEVKYLKNIKLDLLKDLASLESLIEFRERRGHGDKMLIDHINGRDIEDLTVLTKCVMGSLMEEKFTPNNNTYMELSNSGNLNLISNDSIKNLLLELEELYRLNKFGASHEEWDYREYVSKPIFSLTAIDRLYPVFLETSTVDEQQVTHEDFESILEDKRYKNGLYVSVNMSEMFFHLYASIQAKSEQVIKMIDNELRQ